MISVGKRENGITLFSIDQGKKVDIIHNGGLHDIIFSIDTSEDDKNHNGLWFISDMVINREENPDLCDLLGKLHEDFVQLVMTNPEQFILKEGKFSMIRQLLERKKNNEVEVLYPSDDDRYDNATILGLVKKNDDHYCLRFRKGINCYKSSVLIRSGDAARIPEIYNLYEDMIGKLCDITNKSYEECNNEFYGEITKTKILLK